MPSKVPVLGPTYHDHACIALTTGFMVCGWFAGSAGSEWFWSCRRRQAVDVEAVRDGCLQAVRRLA